MKDIKFRVWDKIEKIMYLSPNKLRPIGDWFNALFRNCENEKILMKYIGIEDRHCKEIYVGEVIYEHEYECLLKVVWAQNDHIYIFMKLDDSDYLYPDEIHSEFIEKMGNIYENPELLEG